MNKADAFSRLPVGPAEENPDKERVVNCLNVMSIQDPITTDPQLLERLSKPGPLPPPFSGLGAYRSRITQDRNTANFHYRDRTVRVVLTASQANTVVRFMSTRRPVVVLESGRRSLNSSECTSPPKLTGSQSRHARHVSPANASRETRSPSTQ